MQRGAIIGPTAETEGRSKERRLQAFVPIPRKGTWTAADVESFQQQESSIILLNLLILAGLLLTHVSFQAYLGPPSKLVVIAFAIRFAMQLVELIYLQCREHPLPILTTRIYSVLSIWVHVAFASLVSMLAIGEDTHYTVLMVIPIIAAAFRFSLAGSLGVVAVTSALTFLEVWQYFQLNKSSETLAEYFEAATMLLVFVVVATVVWLLTRRLRQEKARLASALSELEAARDRLVAEEKLAAVGRLSSAVAHEIRNPVAMISSSLTLARQSGTSASLQEEMFEIATKEATRLEQMTGDFLAYAHSKAPERRPVSPQTTLQYIADLVQAQASHADVCVVVDCAREGTIMIDEFQIHRALLNLIRNAIEATPPSGRIVLGAKSLSDGRVALYVENTGEAIPGGMVERMFEPFVSGKPEGTGLGLAIARNIAQAHGGDLILESNTGGCVRLSLIVPEREVAA